MFIAMNNFKVAAGKGEEFERAWRERQSYLDGVPGFVQFALLRGALEGEYISHTTWRDRESFVNWTNSPAFTNAHRQGSLMGVLEGPPQIKTYDAILVETPEGRAVGAS
jgi:heme-degrading monooxygenase HmoA